MCNTAEHAFKEKSAQLLILLPLITIYFYSFQCETPCTRIQTYQISTNDNEVCVPSLSGIILAVKKQQFFVVELLEYKFSKP